jgi:diguanylate cyclase (GGDEF)-like protein
MADDIQAETGWRRWVEAWVRIQRAYDIPGLTLLIATIMAIGIFLVGKHHRDVIVPLLVVPVCLLAWVRGVWWGGMTAGVTALLISPLIPGGDAPITLQPALSWPAWYGVLAGYLACSTTCGLLGRRFQRLQHDVITEMEAKLEKAQASAQRYEALLGELSQGQERLKRMNEELALLNIIATAVNSSLDVSRVQEAAVTHLGSLLDVDEVQIYWYAPHQEVFTLQASQELGADAMAALPALPAAEGIFARLLLSPRAVTISQATGDLYQRPVHMDGQVRSVLALPLRSGTRLLGVLLLGRFSGQPFTEDDERFLDSLGRILSVAIENATLFRQAQELSLSDELTGLANRRMFNMRLGNEISRVKATGTPLCLIIFDLDFFKRVNDEHGHLAGDEVLRQFAQRVQQDIRGGDLLCRFGGEEFALLVPDTGLQITISIAERICRGIAQTPFVLADGVELTLTVSAGVAELRDPAMSAERFVEHADTALYAAKAAGRNQVQVHREAAAVTAEVH